jgi:hypothetical protein
MFRLIGKALKLMLGGLVLLILLALVLPKRDKGQRRDPAPTPEPVAIETPPATQPKPEIIKDSSRLNVGDEVVLDNPKSTLVYLAATDDAWDPLLDAENRGDTEEILVLVKRGKVIPDESGRRAKLIERGFSSCKVRIRGGVNDGDEGWIQREFVHPYDPAAESKPEPIKVIEEAPAPPAKTERSYTTDERADSAFTIGRNLELSSKTDAALKQYRQVIKDYPGTDAATRSEKRIKALSVKP